jgi:hypothetical protein
LSLGARDPEFFLRRFTYGYIGTLYTRAIFESLGYEVKPLDLASFDATFVAWRWSDFVDKLHRRRKYAGFMTAPDLIMERNGRPVCIAEVSRRNGIFYFISNTVKEVKIPGLDVVFVNGIANSFEKYVESFNVIFGTLQAPSLDKAYELIWEKIVKLSRSPKVDFKEIKAVDDVMISRRVKYSKPMIVTTFYINARKLDESWIPTLNSFRHRFGSTFDIYYILWMDDLTQGFIFTTVSEIEKYKGHVTLVERRGERVYEIPLKICKPMYKFPAICEITK